MNANLGFWLGAWLLFGSAVAMVGRGVWLARHQRHDEHRRAMIAACWLIGAFLIAYVAKVLVLGREDRSTWMPADIVVLRVHEALIAAMLLAGTGARLVARRLATGLAGAGGAAPDRRRHRLLGRVTAIAAIAAFGTGSWVLLRMWDDHPRASLAQPRGDTASPR
jgi:uncharacterized membrane protein YozB (DUF420 family)